MTNEDEAKRVFALGSQALKDGDCVGAREHFTHGLEYAISVEIKSALLISRSGALVGLGLGSEALTDAEECQKIRPSWSRTFECKAAALESLGRSDEAKAARNLGTALAELKKDHKNEVGLLPDLGAPARCCILFHLQQHL
jgi:hypothetical protein